MRPCNLILFVLIYLQPASSNCQSPCLERDSLALVALYNSTNGLGWNNVWNLEDPVNTWHGVGRTAEGCVLSVHLEENNLDGEIPREFGNLRNVGHVKFDRNSLRGEIPPEIGTLDSIYSLNLSSNQLTGEIPEELYNLDKLFFLALLDNQLTGNISPKIIDLTLLEYLFVSDNELSGSLPREIAELESLFAVRCANNNFEGCFPNEFAERCNSWTTADFSNNPKLPWQGNFGRFCNGVDQDLAPCDHNDDGFDFDGAIDCDCNCVDVLSAANAHPDYDALMALFVNTDGANWVQKTGWSEGAIGESCNPCNFNGVPWYGIECENGRVVCLDLDDHTNSVADCRGANTALGNNLRGEIPDLQLEELNFLSLSGNDLDTVPNFSSLPNLETLYLYGSGLSGILPQLEFCPKLININFSFNLNLEGQIPDFDNQAELERLVLDNNALSGRLPDISSNLNLKLLQLTNNDIQDSLPAVYAERTWQTLAIRNNDLFGCIPESYLSALCGQNISITGNSQLPWEGDLSLFCAGESQFLAACDHDNNNLTTNGAVDCSCNCVDSASASSIHPDYNALVDFYIATDGPNWTLNSQQGWHDGSDTDNCNPCDYNGVPWNGLLCRNNRVTAIQKSNGVLSGYLPPSIGELTELETIQIGANALGRKVSGPIPDEICNLRNLWGISFSYNNFSSTLPECIGDLTNLSLLSLHHNNLEGQLPSSLSQLTKLDRLVIHANNFSGEIPPIFSDMTDLRYCYLNDNNFSGCFDPDILSICSLDYSSNSNNPGYSFLNNSLLAWEGDLEIYCDSMYSIGAPCDDGNIMTLAEEILDDCTCNEKDELSCNGQHEDYPALIDFYLSTAGPTSWEKTSGWEQGRLEESCNPCDFNGAPWYGIHCENDRVVMLDLDGVVDFDITGTASGVNMKGSLPLAIGDLSELRFLSIYDEPNLSGSLPTTISSLVNLETLSIQRTEINGNINIDFSGLNNLVVVRLSSNLLQGPIPLSLSSAQALEIIVLTNNNLTGEIPEDLTGLRNLTTLYLNNNELEGTLPFNIGDLESLEFLSASNCQLQGSIPVSIGQLSNLISLNLRTNFISGSIPIGLGDLVNLERLELADNNLENDIPLIFSGLNKLTRCYLNDNNLSGCFNPDILAICNLEFSADRRNQGYNFLNNPLLPWEGDLTSYCDSLYSIAAPCDDSNSLTINEEILDDCSCGEKMTIPCRDQHEDFQALIEFYVATGGLISWIVHTGWEEGRLEQNCNPCDYNGQPWYGLRCENNRVVGLDLDGEPDFSSTTGASGNGLAGVLPSSITGVPFLENLILSNNALSGELPTNIGDLQNLKQIIIHHNEFSGELPLSISSLENLEALSIGVNNFSGNLDVRIGDLLKLRNFNISQNNFSGAVPIEYSQLSQLKIFDVSENNLAGELPELFSALPELQKCFFNDNNFEGCFSADALSLCPLGETNNNSQVGYNFSNNLLLPYEGKMSALCPAETSVGAPCNDSNPLTIGEVILEDCSCAFVEDELTCRELDSMTLVQFYEELDDKTFLAGKWNFNEPLELWYGIHLSSEGCVLFLDLDGVNDGGISEYDPSISIGVEGSLNPICKLSSLEKISLSNSEISELNRDSLELLVGLEELALVNCGIDQEINFNWDKMSNLRILNLSNNQLYGELETSFYQLENLIELNLSQNEISGQVDSELKNFSKLQSLQLRQNELSGQIPSSISDLVLLRSLDLGANQFYGEIPRALNKLFLLEKIMFDNNNLSGCFPEELDSLLCDFIPNIDPSEDFGYNFTENELMPWKGDFSKYCADASEEGADCVDSSVDALSFVIENCLCVETEKEDNKDWIFTPNGDGFNDVFVIPEILENPDLYNNVRLVIVNRWGSVIFDTMPYNNDWDGTKNGKEIPDGTYFYILEGGLYEKGKVSVKR